MGKPTDHPMMMAPGYASGVGEVRLPTHDERPAEQPYLDEPEITRWERVDGERMWASPARLEHAVPHAQLDYLLVAHAREGYVTAADLKTRVAIDKEFASDTCLLKDGTDSTDKRHLEELSFEVVRSASGAPRQRKELARVLSGRVAVRAGRRRTGTVERW